MSEVFRGVNILYLSVIESLDDKVTVILSNDDLWGYIKEHDEHVKKMWKKLGRYVQEEGYTIIKLFSSSDIDYYLWNARSIESREWVDDDYQKVSINGNREYWRSSSDL